MKLKISLLFFFFSMLVVAQLEHPKASPAASVIQEVGLSTVAVVYSRPAARGRVIFGDLVPYRRIWRVGANASTKIAIDTDFFVDGHPLAAGTYALYAFPEEDAWDIVFHSNIEHWGDGRDSYNSKEDALRFQVKPEQVATYQENFEIENYVEYALAGQVFLLHLRQE